MLAADKPPMASVQRRTVAKQQERASHQHPPDAGRGPCYLLLLGKACGDDVVAYIVSLLEGSGLMCELRNSEDSYILVSTSSATLKSKQSLSSAEKVQLLAEVIQTTSYDNEFLKKHSHKVEGGKSFLKALLTSHPPILEDAYPLHDKKEHAALYRMLKYSVIPMIRVDTDQIRNYFGEEIAFYFGWMNFYSTCIILPTVIGLAMYVLRPKDTTVDTDPYLPFFSVIMAIWAVLFLVFWQRRCSVHSFCWNTYNLSKSEQLRAEYHGSTCADPITGKPAVYYPSWKRRLWYMFSVVSMLPLLVLGVAIMTLSLNLNGYVKNTESPIYIEWLAAYAQPGGLFAGDSPYFLWLVPTLAHSIVVSAINQLYSTVAEKCTNLENHRTVHRWHSSLVIKRVFFECFDCFMPLFYIAFYQLDVITLRAEIVSLFMSDEIRRVFVETVVPFVKDLCVSGVRKKKGRESVPDLLLNAEYDTFDDYLEMVIQFGYITLFASAFPLGSAVTLLFLYVEIRSDLFKLLHVYRRPMPRRARDIGVWFDVMRVMVFVAILTNCAILGFSSEQLMQWTPSLFSRDLSGGGDQVMAMGSGRYVVGVVFGFEHLLLVIAVWLQCVIKPEPKWVRVAIARREYLAKEKAKKH